MRRIFIVTAAALSLAAVPALAQTRMSQTGIPAGDNPVTGARPGNIPGTNNSLPLGNTASNLAPGDTRSDIAPHLPTPAVGEDASIGQYLASARQALDGHHTGMAQQALEMAETRALDRSTLSSQANTPDQSPLVTTIQQALDGLGRKDMTATDQAIDRAMALAGSAPSSSGATKM